MLKVAPRLAPLPHVPTLIQGREMIRMRINFLRTDFQRKMREHESPAVQKAITRFNLALMQPYPEISAVLVEDAGLHPSHEEFATLLNVYGLVMYQETEQVWLQPTDPSLWEHIHAMDKFLHNMRLVRMELKKYSVCVELTSIEDFLERNAPLTARVLVSDEEKRDMLIQCAREMGFTVVDDADADGELILSVE